MSSTPFSMAIGRALGTVVVTAHGDLDDAGAANLERVLDDLIDGQGNLHVVVDLHDVGAVGPSGLSMFARR
ncbi:MAG: STAS domain-containing protein [Acidimicrobiales bacterium]